ncbi:MAG TPA: TlpA disulfide reductase family protein [Holophagaceae bacterium]|nr:TlpA disulfide reductase family protein [Holophagaceae bacterium]
MTRCMVFLTLPGLLLSAQDPGVDTVIKRTQAHLVALRNQFQAFTESGRDPKQFRPDFSTILKELDAGLAANPSAEVKEVLLVSKLTFGRMGALPKPELNALALRARQEVPGRSRAWVLDPELFVRLGTPAMLAEAVEANPEVKVRALVLQTRGEALLRVNKGEEAASILARMEAEFPKEAATEALRKAYEAAAPTFPGRPAPQFKLTNLEDSAQSFALVDFRGKYLLLDFWASWCGPCRAEMPELHQAWERFKGPRFEILSLSLDRTAGDVGRFRKEPGHAMPWKHAYLSGGFDHDLVRTLGINSIPRPVLLGPDGRVVASGDELRGADLLTTLERVLK